MKHIHFVRHGETTYNHDGLVQDSEVSLNERGLKQANTVAGRVQHIDFDNFLVSDYLRTKQTAVPISQLTGKEPEYTDLLREIRRPNVFWHKSNTSDEYLAFLKSATENYDKPDWFHSNEENFFAVLHRVEALFEKLDSFEADTLLVSHGHLIRFITMYVLSDRKLTPELWRQSQYNIVASNTGITVMEYNETYKQWRLLTFNDHAHFAE